VVRVGLDLITIVIEVSQALALAILTSCAVSPARATAAETILSGFNALPEHHLVDEAEIAREDGIVDVVDDCDGDGFMSGK
jgi:hypothetical protein